MQLNEIMIVDHPGDNLDDLINTGLNIVKIETVKWVVFRFNGIKLFVVKNSTAESVKKEYEHKEYLRKR